MMILEGNSSQSSHSVVRKLISYLIVGYIDIDVCRESL